MFTNRHAVSSARACRILRMPTDHGPAAQWPGSVRSNDRTQPPVERVDRYWSTWAETDLRTAPTPMGSFPPAACEWCTYSKRRMREIRISGSMSGTCIGSTTGPLGHHQPKEAKTDSPNIFHRGTSRPSSQDPEHPGIRQGGPLYSKVGSVQLVPALSREECTDRLQGWGIDPR